MEVTTIGLGVIRDREGPPNLVVGTTGEGAETGKKLGVGYME